MHSYTFFIGLTFLPFLTTAYTYGALQTREFKLPKCGSTDFQHVKRSLEEDDYEPFELLTRSLDPEFFFEDGSSMLSMRDILQLEHILVAREDPYKAFEREYSASIDGWRRVINDKDKTSFDKGEETDKLIKSARQVIDLRVAAAKQRNGGDKGHKTQIAWWRALEKDCIAVRSEHRAAWKIQQLKLKREGKDGKAETSAAGGNTNAAPGQRGQAQRGPAQGGKGKRT